MSTPATPPEPTKTETQNAAHTLVQKALEEMGKAIHFTEDEVKTLAEKLLGKL